MPLEFTKMHALGNDYVYVCTHRQRVDDPATLARRIADRHRGVGGDGLILIAPAESPEAHVRMVLYNADGSRGQMCGNGIRCVAKYAYEHGLARTSPMRVQTDHGTLTCELRRDPRDRVEAVRVDMGPPILEPARVPAVPPTNERALCPGPRPATAAHGHVGARQRHHPGVRHRRLRRVRGRRAHRQGRA